MADGVAGVCELVGGGGNKNSKILSPKAFMWHQAEVRGHLISCLYLASPCPILIPLLPLRLLLRALSR